jgi:hypothetical protein
LSCHYDVILNANAAEPLDIYTRLDCNDHTLFEQGLFVHAQTRHFMHFDSQPVSCAVGEVPDETMAPKNFARRSINVTRFGARPNGHLGGMLCLQDGGVKPANPACSPSQENSASHIAAVAAQYSTLVKDDQVVFLEQLGRGLGVRPGGARTRGNDGVKRWSTCAAEFHGSIQLSGHG